MKASVGREVFLFPKVRGGGEGETTVFTTEIAGKFIIEPTVLKLQTVKAVNHTDWEVSEVRFHVCGRFLIYAVRTSAHDALGH